MTQAKICGLTTAETLDAALDGGAAYVGLVSFAKSPRHLSLDAAATLAERARGRAGVVVVTVDPDDALLTEIGLKVRPDFIQLHGHEAPDRAEAVRRLTGAGVIKALPISDPGDFAAAADWEPVVDHLMFDARPPKGAALPGGVGAAFDWTLMTGRTFARPWFLAGGLTPENVGQAIRITDAPLADVSSGVESAPGVKDAGRIAAFLEAVRRP
jgi:phosphoribosylanthranilate isomerase